MFVLYIPGMHRKLVNLFNILGLPTAIPVAGGGIHNDSSGGGLAWKDIPRSVPSKAPLPSGIFTFEILGGGRGVRYPPPEMLRPP